MGTYAGMKVFQRIKNAEWQRVSKALEKVDMGKYSNHQIENYLEDNFNVYF